VSSASASFKRSATIPGSISPKSPPPSVFRKTYAEAVRWHLDAPIPESARGLVVRARSLLDCDFVFSALDSSVAGPAEEDFARAGYPVVSNSRNHRMDPDVPLLIPEVNAAHLDAIPRQQKIRLRTGFIVTNPNCSTAGLVLVLKTARRRLRPREIFVSHCKPSPAQAIQASRDGHQATSFPSSARRRKKWSSSRKSSSQMDGSRLLTPAWS